MSKFSVIAAITRDYGLGYKNNLPWHKFPLDMKWFREQTKDQTVIMGSKTWKSMNCQPLPNRQNIILSRSSTDQLNTATSSNVHFTTSLDAALSKISTPKTFVIGGADIYRQAIEHQNCESLLITHVDIKVPADVYFPNITADNYVISKVHKRGAKGKIILFSDPSQSQSDKSSDLQNNESEVPYEIIEYIRAQPYHHPSTTYVGEAGYLKALKDIIEYGETRHDRTGVGTKALFGLQFRYNLEKGFPLLTTKKMFTKGVIGELLWFLKGQTDVGILREQGIHIWDGNSTREFLDSRGLKHLPDWDIGPSYGFQFRHAGAKYQTAQTDYFSQQPRYDQVEYVINELKNNPHGRRAIINLWNPTDLNEMALPPCLFLYQFWVSENKYLHLSLYQRSGDMGLGVPFNIASASTLMNIVGKLTGLIPRELVHHIGDAHIYNDHIEPLKRQITRIPRPFPQLIIQNRSQTRVEDFQLDDFQIEGYQPYPGIKMDMAV